MKLRQILIKNFHDYVNGNEVEATAEIKEGNIIRPGEHVMVFKDSFAALSDIPVPREKQDLSIGIEGTVIQTIISESEEKGRHLQKIKVKKI